LTEKKFRQIIKYFSDDFNENLTAKYTNLNKNTISRIFIKIRKRIYELSKINKPFLGKIEIDESYFGAKRIRGKR
jgi:hypothetical protein